MAARHLVLLVLDEHFAVSRLASDTPIPAWVGGPFSSVTRTAEELSIVCRQDVVPEEVQCERGWRYLRVEGTLPFSAVGVLAALAAPLAEAGVSVFAISTFDTDHLLVKEKDLREAVEALRRQGHTVEFRGG
jgi:hypothetical protein